MIKELPKEIKAALYERVKAPVIGAFIVSWCLYNWQELIVFIFGNGKLEDRVSNFHDYLYSTSDLSFGPVKPDFQESLFFYPLFFAILFFLILPLIELLAYTYKERVKTEALKVKEKFDRQLRLDLDQSNLIRDQLSKKFEHLEKQASDQSETISALENSVLERDGLINEKEKKFIEVMKQKATMEDKSIQITSQMTDLKDTKNALSKQISSIVSIIGLVSKLKMSKYRHEEYTRIKNTSTKYSDEYSDLAKIYFTNGVAASKNFYEIKNIYDQAIVNEKSVDFVFHISIESLKQLLVLLGSGLKVPEAKLIEFTSLCEANLEYASSKKPGGANNIYVFHEKELETLLSSAKTFLEIGN